MKDEELGYYPEERRDNYIAYKIEPNRPYKVAVDFNAGKTFYSIPITKRDFVGKGITYYKPVKFVKCTPPQNNEIIVITRGFEDFYENPRDKFHPVFCIVVMEWEPYYKDGNEIETDAREKLRIAMEKIPF